MDNKEFVMKKICLFTAILLVFGLSFMSAQVWESKAPANFKVNIAKNQYGEGYQWLGNASWLFNKNQMKEGEEYELEMEFTSDLDIPNLMICLVDQHVSVKYWKVLSIPTPETDWPELDVKAKTPVSVKIPFTIYHTATNASTEANKLCFDYKTGAKKAANLTFTKFIFRRTK